MESHYPLFTDKFLVEGLAAHAAVALDNLKLIDSRKNLLERG